MNPPNRRSAHRQEHVSLPPDTRRCHAVADTVVLNGQDIGQAHPATSAATRPAVPVR